MAAVQIPKTMKAGQYDPKLKKMVVNSVPVPTPSKNEILVKMRSASLCHSDLMSIALTSEDDSPVTIGHEGAGYIVQIDPSVPSNKNFTTGQAVGFGYIVGCCFECAGCQVHNLHCTNGKPQIQGWGDCPGFFAEYAVVDYRNVVVLDEGKWDMDVACATFCAGITAFHSLDSCSDDLRSGDWVGILGCGGLGQVATQYAKAMGFKVVGIDIADPNLEMTRKQGADAVFNSMKNPDYVEEIRKLTGGGCKAVIVYTNSEKAFAGAPPLIALGGTLMIIGLPAKPIEVSAMDLALGKYKIKADSTSIPQRMPKAVKFTEEHNIMPVVDVRGGLEQLAAMVEEMQAGKNSQRTGVVFK